MGAMCPGATPFRFAAREGTVDPIHQEGERCRPAQRRPRASRSSRGTEPDDAPATIRGGTPRERCQFSAGRACPAAAPRARGRARGPGRWGLVGHLKTPYADIRCGGMPPRQGAVRRKRGIPYGCNGHQDAPPRARLPLHLRERDGGPSRQGLRPDFRRRARRHPRQGGPPAGRRLRIAHGRAGRPRAHPLRLRVPRHHGPRARIGRDPHAGLRRRRGDRAWGAQAHRLRPGQVRLRRRDVQRAVGHPRPVARHRPGRRRKLRGAAGRLGRRRPARPDRRRRPGHDVRLRGARDADPHADAHLPRPPALCPPRAGPQGRHAGLPAPRRQDAGVGALRGRAPGRGGEDRRARPSTTTASTRRRSAPTSSAPYSRRCSTSRASPGAAPRST